MPKITKKPLSQEVREIFLDCLFKDDEPHENFVEVQGIVSRFGFHPGRLESHRAEIIEILNQLPEQFHEEIGGGWSFLNACITKDGEHWAEHPTVEQLIALGLAIGKVAYLLPRELWKQLPGGMPYIVIKTEK